MEGYGVCGYVGMWVFCGYVGMYVGVDYMSVYMAIYACVCVCMHACAPMYLLVIHLSDVVELLL